MPNNSVLCTTVMCVCVVFLCVCGAIASPYASNVIYLVTQLLVSFV